MVKVRHYPGIEDILIQNAEQQQEEPYLERIEEHHHFAPVKFRWTEAMVLSC